MAAERWQLWMPFHIDRFRGSLHVQGMSSTAKLGFLYLLSAAWQTSDCSLENDVHDLQVLSSLSLKEWDKAGPVIMRRFKVREDGRLYNPTCVALWEEQRAKYYKGHATPGEISAARSAAGKAGNEKRWAEHRKDRNLSQTDGTCDTEKSQTDRNGSLRREEKRREEKREEKDSCAAASATPAVIGMPLVSGELHLVTQETLNRYAESYPAVDVMQELRKMREWCLANARNRKTAAGIERFMANWLGKEQDKAPRMASGRLQPGMRAEPAEVKVEEDVEGVQLDHWRDLKGKGFPLTRCPAWIKAELAAEETQGRVYAEAG